MLRPITRKMTDESGGGTYRFTFYCDVCGKPYQSPAYDSTVVTVPDRRAQEIEYNDAYERANNEVLKNFNRCPACQRVVCDECFNILEDMDICRVCSAPATAEIIRRDRNGTY